MIRRLTDQVTFGVLASSVPSDAVDDAVAVAGRQARRRDGKLPPHVMVYFAIAMALFADDGYEEVAARMAGTLWRRATALARRCLLSGGATKRPGSPVRSDAAARTGSYDRDI